MQAFSFVEQDDTDFLETERAIEQPTPLEYFGYDLFAGVPTTFAPATDIPMDADYIVGPGDTVRVQLFGNVNSVYEYDVSRDGILNLPELGPVNVTGIRFSEFRDDIRRRLANIYRQHSDRRQQGVAMV